MLFVRYIFILHDTKKPPWHHPDKCIQPMFAAFCRYNTENLLQANYPLTYFLDIRN